MENSKLKDFKINNEPQETTQIEVAQFELLNSSPVIREFKFDAIKKDTDGNYDAIKAKYGPLAVTDADKGSASQKGYRFSLNPLVKEPLSIEQEERRAIEEKVRTRVEAIANEAKSAASELGYQEGMKKGYEEAYKKMRLEGTERLTRLDKFIEESENAKIEIFKANERLLIELIFKISKMILLKEITADREFLLRLAKELINIVGVKDNIKLKISTDDAQTIDLLKDGLEKNYGQLANLSIEVSSQIAQGGCQIETEWNVIHANLDKQLQSIYESLTGTKSGGDS